MYYTPYEEMYKKVLEKFENTNVKNPINHKLVKSAFNKKKENAHKGTCGSLLICAGSPGLTGAGCLSAMGAARCGCGLVTLACSEDLNTIFEIKLTETMTMPLPSENGIIKPDAYDKISDKLKSCNAFLYGPGLSTNPAIKELLYKLMINSNIPMVIDADGLNVMSDNKDILKQTSAPVILTPHIGEFARLTGYNKEYILNNTTYLAEEFAREYNVIMVLKSHRTVVTNGYETYENILGSPAMAVGGSGDVLSGMIASFLAQGNTPFKSALAGVYLHSLAADMATLEYGELSLLPTDTIRYISYAAKITSDRQDDL